MKTQLVFKIKLEKLKISDITLLYKILSLLL